MLRFGIDSLLLLLFPTRTVVLAGLRVPARGLDAITCQVTLSRTAIPEAEEGDVIATPTKKKRRTNKGAVDTTAKSGRSGKRGASVAAASTDVDADGDADDNEVEDGEVGEDSGAETNEEEVPKVQPSPRKRGRAAAAAHGGIGAVSAPPAAVRCSFTVQPLPRAPYYWTVKAAGTITCGKPFGQTISARIVDSMENVLTQPLQQRVGITAPVPVLTIAPATGSNDDDDDDDDEEEKNDHASTGARGAARRGGADGVSAMDTSDLPSTADSLTQPRVMDPTPSSAMSLSLTPSDVLSPTGASASGATFSETVLDADFTLTKEGLFMFPKAVYHARADTYRLRVRSKLQPAGAAGAASTIVQRSKAISVKVCYLSAFVQTNATRSGMILIAWTR